MKQKIPLIIGALFAIVMLLAHNNIEKAYAISFVDVSLGGGLSPVAHPAQGDTWFSTSLGIAERWIPTGAGVSILNMKADTMSSFSISGGGVTDVKCGSAWCFAWQSTTTPFRIWAIDAQSRTILGVINGTDGNEGGSAIEVLDTVTGGLGGISVFVPLHNTNCDGLGGGNYVIAIMDGSIIANSGTFNDACSGILSIGDFVTGVAHSGLTQQVVGDNRNILAVRVLNALTQNFHIYSMTTLTRICDANIQNSQNWVLEDDGVFWTSNDDGWAVIGYDIPETGSANCVADFSIATPTNYFQYGFAIDTENDLVFVSTVFNGGTDSYISVRNQSALSEELFRLSMPDGATGALTYYPAQDELIAYSDANNVARIFKFGGAGSAGSSETCIDTNLDGATDLCFTDTNNDGIPDNGALGALGAYRSNANLTSFGTDVFCAFGINTNACEDRNIQTNGVGIVYLMVIIIISYAFLVYVHYQAQYALNKDNIQVMDALAVNPLLLLTMLILDVTLAWYMQWIPDLIFYTTIVVMVGLSAFGIYRKVTSAGG